MFFIRFWKKKCRKARKLLFLYVNKNKDNNTINTRGVVRTLANNYYGDIFAKIVNSFMKKVPICIETSLLICWANWWDGFYKIGTSVMNELTTFIGKQFLQKSSVVDVSQGPEHPFQKQPP